MAFEKFTNTGRDYIRFYYVTDDLRTEAHKLTSYQGKNIKDKTITEIELSADERPFIDHHLKDALFDIGKGFIDIMADNQDSIFFDETISIGGSSLDVTGLYVIDYKGYNAVDLPTVDQKLKDCLVLQTVKEWYLNIALPDYWKIYEAKYALNRTQLRKVAFPLRKIGELYYYNYFDDKAMKFYAQKNQIPIPTAGDNSSTGLTLDYIPIGDSDVMVFARGMHTAVGENATLSYCYFSRDGGTTAVAVADILDGDVFYWNGVQTGIELDADDLITFYYPINQ